MLLQLFKSSFDPLMTSECFQIWPHTENSGNKNPINETESETEPKHRDEQAEESNLGMKTPFQNKTENAEAGEEGIENSYLGIQLQIYLKTNERK